jgi:rare lipoprotein A
MNKLYTIALIIGLIFMSACSTSGKRIYRGKQYTHKVNKSNKTYSTYQNPKSKKIDKKIYTHPTMRPYVIRGIKYYPTVVSVGDSFKGNASWYGPDFHGKLTSNGEIYDMYKMTAAHKTLPMNTIVKVTNRKNGLSTVVRINDRGPFIATRIIDLSNTAAKKIKMLGEGTAPVTLEILGFQPVNKKIIPTKKQLTKLPKTKFMGGYALQIASFLRIQGALSTQSKYDNTNGYRTIIKDLEINGRQVFKVWLKGFKSEKEARDYKALGNFKNAFIVREY